MKFAILGDSSYNAFMKNQQPTIIQYLTSALGVCIFIVMAIFAIIMFSYLFIIGAAIGLVLFLVIYIRIRWLKHKYKHYQQNNKIHHGRTIDQ
ncbi:MAG: LapA family protein [Gammaproteobacteria bacterium]|nr:LapA family protein [Gammaproteobacteria bacterium]